MFVRILKRAAKVFVVVSVLQYSICRTFINKWSLHFIKQVRKPNSERYEFELNSDVSQPKFVHFMPSWGTRIRKDFVSWRYDVRSHEPSASLKKGESIVGCQPYEKTRIQQQFVLVTETVSGTVTETIRAQDSNKKLLHRERFEAEVLKHHGETHKGQGATYDSMVLEFAYVPQKLVRNVVAKCVICATRRDWICITVFIAWCFSE